MKINIKAQDVYNYIEISQVKTWTYKYNMCCSVFAPFINLYSNTDYWIYKSVDDVYQDIDKAIEICLKNWTLDLKKWGWYAKNCDTVAETRLANLLEFTKNEAVFKELYEKWYMIQANISVNKNFINDLKDDGKINWFLEAEKYTSAPVTYNHTFNIKRKDDSNCYITDSVYPVVHGQLVEFSFEKMFKIIKPNCRCFI